ncbi:pyrroline-5-carboxylate reductase [Spirochaeta thermophila]|uniref:Pyrroline-5-carboxylate reductase n=1 Tax=Winmispira thermophila (strain ATCC 49972 / DSM 6192 / RI 19.B1) TaxID=665571 RepID=E0RQ23_WINT6|nr:pyrroline-5-carboxylate reductase [Spirochaeta thermophila]ADN02876.1 pyrroline-5-carboxylate reductase [Spirochaeta thermophila DSM 6192]
MEIRTVGCVGFGVMGETLVKGIRRAFPEVRLMVVEKVGERVQRACEEYGAEDTTATPARVFTEADLVILAVKPQDREALKGMAPDATRAAIFSIIAGTPIRFFEETFGTREIVRVMPNIAAMVQKAPMGMSFHPLASEGTRTQALAVARAVGTPFEIPERLMPAFTGLSGSGIAYVLSFLHGMALAGTMTGIPYTESLRIVEALVEGTVALRRETDRHPEEMLTWVTSPAGTTIQGVHTLERGGFKALLMDAVKRAADRAQEFEG